MCGERANDGKQVDRRGVGRGKYQHQQEAIMFQEYMSETSARKVEPERPVLPANGDSVGDSVVDSVEQDDEAPPNHSRCPRQH